MNMDDLRDLDFKKLGLAPAPIRVGFAVIVFGAVLGLGYYLDTDTQRTELQGLEAQEPPLRQEIEKKQRQVANLEALKQQLAEMEKRFGALLRQLPSKAEAENLIVDVAQTSLQNGLTNQQIQPGTEVLLDFYAEMPYTLKFRGDYHNFSKFVSDVAKLPRIVTLHNFKVSLDTKQQNTPGAGSDLDMSVVAKTYRYLDKEEGTP
ncbi:MAG: type 4a pilus biogenesis protein PilO [Halothiobacillaceae bacterium]|jgi:type IV pilus assembly protein PilO|nr:type 4a pilus biogenesis protein PilO [Halothiobacillaceae bacterium]MDY0050216.1 type 4a pilus biogenesis protein PilO [Halothiobacillaceae bacterium]